MYPLDLQVVGSMLASVGLALVKHYRSWNNMGTLIASRPLYRT